MKSLSLKETDFKQIFPHELTYFAFNENYEVYFKLTSSNIDNDLIFKFSQRNGYTIEMYLFKSFEDIKYTNQTYSGYRALIHFNGEQEFHFLENENKIKKEKSKEKVTNQEYYIIIRDPIKLIKFSSYIQFFNEFDPFQLKINQPFLIERFYKTNKLDFHFIQKKNTNLLLSIRNEAAENEHIIYLKNITGKTEIELFNRTDSEFIFNISKTTIETIFKISIISNANPYENVQKIIAVYEKENELIKIQENVDNTYYALNDTNVKFYFNLDDYELNEENICILELDFNMTKKFKNIYGLVANIDTDDLQALIDAFPKNEAENNITFKQSGDKDYIYELYFSKFIEKQNKKTTYLLVNVDIGNDIHNLIFYPQKISLYLPNKINVININNEEETHKYSLSVKGDRPYILKFNLKSDLNYFIMQTGNEQGILINGSLNKGSVINYPDYTEDLFIIKNPDYPSNETISLITYKFLGDKQTVTFTITSAKNVKSLTKNNDIEYIQLLNGDSYYFLDENCSDFKGYFFEQEFGKTLYYAKDTWQKTLYENILPNDEESKVQSLFSKTDNSHFSILGLITYNPSSLFIYKVNPCEKFEMNENSNKILMLEKNIKTIIYLPSIEDQVRITIYDNSETDIDITSILGEIKLNKTNKHCELRITVSISDEETRKIVFKSKENSIVIINLNTKKDLYTEIPITGGSFNQTNIVLQFPRNNNYLSISLTLSDLNYDFSYILYRNPINNTEYLPLVDNIINKVDVKISTSGKYVNEFENPYYKSPYYQDEFYYLMISFHANNENINDIKNYTVKIKEQLKDIHPILEENSFGYLSQKSKGFIEKYQMKQDFLDNSFFFIVAHSCDTEVNKNIWIDSYNESILNVNISKALTLIEMKNNFKDNQISINKIDSLEDYDGVEISYKVLEAKKRINESEIDKYNSMDLKINFDLSNKNISWSKLDNAASYSIYFLPKSSKDRTWKINNICYLEKSNDSDIQIFEIENKTCFDFEKMIGDYVVTVIANIDEPIQMKVKYKYKIINIPDNSKGTRKTFWIVISILIIVVVIGAILVFWIKIKDKNTKRMDHDALISEFDSLGIAPQAPQLS